MLAQIPNIIIESISSEKTASVLNKECEALNRCVRVFVQVNTSGETCIVILTPAKSGVDINGLVAICSYIMTACPNLSLVGLMTIGAPNNIDENGKNRDFAELSKCREIVGKEFPRLSGLEMSMGMSDDYELAIKMGSTNVRVGSSIFGARNYNK